MFEPKEWARRWRENQDRAERNAYMDSGWRASEVYACDAESARLARELLDAMREIQATSEDFFDRPELVAVLAAAYESAPASNTKGQV